MLEEFDRIYIINLAHREDRRKEIALQFEEIGASIDNERIRVFSAVKPVGAEGFPTVGVRGCYLSHLAILKDARSAGFSYILIVEDDCNFVKNFVQKSVAHLRILKLHKPDFFYFSALNTIDPKVVSKGRILSDQGIMGAHCVGFSGKVLGPLIEYLEAILARSPGDPLGGPMHIDGAYSRFRAQSQEFTTYLAVPELAYQRFSPTDIHDKSNFRIFWDASYIGYFYRMMKNFLRKQRK